MVTAEAVAAAPGRAGGAPGRWVRHGKPGAAARAQFGRRGVGAQIVGVVGRFARRAGRDRQGPGTGTAVAFVAGQGIEPGPEPAMLAEPAQLAGGDDERVLDRVA